MKFMCSICREVFTGGLEETIFTTKCGHIYHHHCILQSIESSKTCPYCRTPLTKTSIFKLNFCLDERDETEIEIDSCVEVNLNLLSLKNMEIEDIKRSSKHAIETNEALKFEVEMHEANARAHSKIIFRLEENIRTLEALLKSKIEESPRKDENNLGSHGNMSSNSIRGTNAAMDVINLADISDPEILEDIKYARLEQRTFDNDIEVIDLESPESSRSHNSHMEKIKELESQLELKNAMLNSALVQIETLEKQLNTLNSNFAQFETL